VSVAIDDVAGSAEFGLVTFATPGTVDAEDDGPPDATFLLGVQAATAPRRLHMIARATKRPALSMLERYLHQRRGAHVSTIRVAVDLVPETSPKTHSPAALTVVLSCRNSRCHRHLVL
jgi:hypothetical protein